MRSQQAKVAQVPPYLEVLDTVADRVDSTSVNGMTRRCGRKVGGDMRTEWLGTDLRSRRVLGFAALWISVCANPALAQSNCDARALLRPGSQCEGDEHDAAEQTLARAINEYRARSRLPPIPLSPALAIVANRHARDMVLGGITRGHDWSNCRLSQGSDCMWSAPERLGVAYPGMVFEMSYDNGSDLLAEKVRDALWMYTSKPEGTHNKVITNGPGWGDKTWRAMGIGIYRNWALVWVGEAVDSGMPVASSAAAPAVGASSSDAMRLVGAWKGMFDGAMLTIANRQGEVVFQSKEGNPLAEYEGTLTANGPEVTLSYEGDAAGWTCQLKVLPRARLNDQQVLAGSCRGPKGERTTVQFGRVRP